ncbi:hypothetical protein [Halpernia sp.]|uniref:hypothetical protein n=1 Tax=Halpernia sp. TaxID=2782209 RepID=UPI003A90DB4A
MTKKFIFFGNVLLLIVCSYHVISTVISFAGSYIYPLDDAYIHLSMAKNFAQFGIWGITKYEFSSTSSSPFFTLLLSLLIKIFGNYQYISIILNSLVALSLIVLLHRILIKEKTLVHGIIFTATIWLMPLHTMVLIGMEHISHTLTLLLCLLFFKKYLENNKTKYFYLMLLFAFVSVGFRFESLFFIFFMCVFLFFLKKEYFKSIILGIIAVSPVLIYGLISVSKGSFFLPNSLMLKGNMNDGISGFLMRVLGNGYRAISILPFVVLLIIQLLAEKKRNIKIFFSKNALQIIVFLGFCVHLCFANFGWLERYESYLLVILLVACIPSIKWIFAQPKVIYKISFFILLLIPLNFRLISMLKNETIASKNIFEQQVQMARFLNKYYNNSKVVANDIGAISYFTNIHLLDTYGLGSVNVAKIREKDFGKFNKNNQSLRNFVQTYTTSEKYDIAIVYDSWLKMPDNFTFAGSWTIQNNYICGNPKVSFYSVNPKNYTALVSNLQKFKKKLPKTIEVKILSDK